MCLGLIRGSVGRVLAKHAQGPGSNLQDHIKMGAAAHTYNPSVLKMEGTSKVQDCPWLHKEFEASLGYMKFCLNKIK